MPGKYNLICILGPTASGKTAFAAHIAAVTGGEIISADSRQVYRGMDIGTGKDYSDYRLEHVKIPYHLIDIADAGEEYNLFRFQQDFQRVFADLLSREIMPVLCGGTGLYLESVLKGYSMREVPENAELRKELESLDTGALVKRLESCKNPHNTTDTLIRERLIRAIEIEENTRENPGAGSQAEEVKPVVFGLDIDRESRRERITERLKQRLDSGMADEVKQLLQSGIPPGKLEFYGLEYRYLSRYIRGEISYDEMFRSLNIAIHQFAKRQMTWFRKMEREGIRINWIDALLPMEEKIAAAMKYLE